MPGSGTHGLSVYARFCALVASLMIGTVHSSVAQARPIAASTHGSIPRFEAGPCPFHPGSGFTVGTNVQCGTLVVEADHTKPAAGVMRLAVAIFRTPSPYRLPDPVVYLSGGPGYGAVDIGDGLSTKDAPGFLGNHDLILIDQRGTGHSLPQPTCIRADRPKGLDPNSNAGYARYLAICHARLDRLGASPSLFTTTQSADDIADLRPALNLPRMDLYGVSYGTTLALEIMRRHPKDLRSVVLDSVVPTDFENSASIRAESRGFHALFVGCGRSSHCRKHSPHLKRTFHQALVRLAQHAATFTTHNKGGHVVNHRVNGVDFAELVRELLYDTSSLPDIPRLITKVAAGQYGLLPKYVHSTTQYFSGNSEGVFRSVECAESIPLDTPSRVRAAIATLPTPIKADARRGERDQLAECRAWNVPKVDPAFYEPVYSTIPTLLLQGEYDPITPPSNATHAAATLPHSFHYLFPGTGHGVRGTDPCPDRMVNTFYDVPKRTPDSSCIAQMSEPF